MSRRGRIVRIAGALVEAQPMGAVSLNELVRVGKLGLLGEVIRVEHDTAVVQVYEDTTGLELGGPVEATGNALTIQLGPGLLGSVLDGLGRPLARLADQTGHVLLPGIGAPTLEPERRWRFVPVVAAGERIEPGDVLGHVQETASLSHPILVPIGSGGTLSQISGGEFTVDEPLGHTERGTPLTLAHHWPVRQTRPVKRRLRTDTPLITGQRLLDFLFPVAEGGTVSVPGGFGTGKTVIEQSLAKYAAADVVVYVGCGERGNEIAEVLTEFPTLVASDTVHSVLERTVLVVNTSNMPVAAREASVYVGVTVAEYYRDLGYRVAVMADSLSRWAEALREMSARLQEMPGEEGYPTYLGNRLAKWYERAGTVIALGEPERTGALTIISAVSPPGGDFSEPVTQASMRVTGALWALDAALANARQFPAVDWETSYSLYESGTDCWFSEHVSSDWPALRREVLEWLQKDRELREIAALVGHDALQDEDRLIMETARMLREVVLGQNAYHPNDAFSPTEKTYSLVKLVRAFYLTTLRVLRGGVSLDGVEIAPIRQRLVSLRHETPDGFAGRAKEAERSIAKLDGPLLRPSEAQNVVSSAGTVVP